MNDVRKDHEEKRHINIAYIDGTNLYKSLTESLEWRLDYKRFRIWLREKYKVEQALIFIGFIPKYTNIYRYLRESGFELIFKEVIYQAGMPKGNCDSDLLMRACIDLYEGNLNKAIIVASDGDYAPLVKVLHHRGKLNVILSPSPIEKCSLLLRRIGAPIVFINDKRFILQKSV
jgi:hypothetical protein